MHACLFTWWSLCIANFVRIAIPPWSANIEMISAVVRFGMYAHQGILPS